MYNLVKHCNSGWKMTPLAYWSPINPVLTIIFSLPPGQGFRGKKEKSVMLSVLFILYCRSTLCFLVTGDVGRSWLAHRALTRLCSPVYSTATFTAAVSSQFKLDLKERVTTNEIKRELAQTAAADLLPSGSHATANVSLLARLQKLSTAACFAKQVLMFSPLSDFPLLVFSKVPDITSVVLRDLLNKLRELNWPHWPLVKCINCMSVRHKTPVKICHAPNPVCDIHVIVQPNPLESVQYEGIGDPHDIVLLASVDHDRWFAQEQSAAAWLSLRERATSHKVQTPDTLMFEKKQLENWWIFFFLNKKMLYTYSIKPSVSWIFCTLPNLLFSVTSAAVFIDKNLTRSFATSLTICHSCYLVIQRCHLHYLYRR